MHILAHRLRTTLRLAMLAAAACAPIAGNAQVAIEQQPLIVAKPLPPNILLILDDSASMNALHMPDTLPLSSLHNDIRLRSATVNSLWYDPRKTYLPWKNWNGTLWKQYDPMVENVPYDPAPAAVRTTSSALDFRTLTSFPSIGSSLNTSVTGGTGRFQGFYWYDSGSTTTPNSYRRLDFRWNSSNPQRWIARICTGTSTSGCTTYDGNNTQLPTPMNRTVQQEIQNYANWFAYHRLRISMAKAAASHVFSDLGEDYRIGYTSLTRDALLFPIPVGTESGLFRGTNKQNWFTRLLEQTGAPGGVGTRLRWSLDQAGQYFRETGSDGPYGPEATADQYSCRQNFTILTTDGYWTNNWNSNKTVDSTAAPTAAARANNDGAGGPTIEGPGGASYTYQAVRPYTDAVGNTLADVAMYYWKNDLRTDMANNVPTSAANPAFWQHMVTFGVSIGEKGTLNPATDLPALTRPLNEAGAKSWPNPTTNTGAERIDDLWHAALNSRGEFILANDTEEFSNALQSALGTIASRLGSGGSLAGNEATQFGNNTYSFQAQYWSGSWHGELSAYEILSNGRLATDPTWVASDQLPTWSARQIYVHDRQHASSKYKSFTWGTLSHSAQSALGSADVLEYLRGNRSKERSQPGGTLRTRGSALGDIVNSQPVYVGPPSPQLYQVAGFSGAAGYQTFITQKKNRDPILYVGANDGMLHGFDANTGEETYAFIPNAVLAHLKHLADPDYKHRYFVDGELTVADAYDTGNGWRTILIGTLGRGGRGVFALDVTDPQGVQFLWERDASDIPALGNNLGKPIIAQVANGDWRVLIGNGPNGSGNRAQLIMIDVFSGAVTTVDSGEIGSQGLSAVRAWDADHDGFTDTAYAGDFAGNLWRIRGLPDEPEFEKLFQAQHSGKAQPITAAPLVGINSSNDLTWVFFGTGSYLNETDLPNKDVQTWYGLIDRGEEIASRAELLQRQILSDGTVGGFPVRTIAQGSVSDMVGKSGWYIDLMPPDAEPAEGERMVLPNRFGSGALIGVTRIPDGSNACSPSGRGWVYAIHPFSGARLALIFLDLTRDGQFNSADTLNGAAPSALRFDAGLNNPLLFLNTMQFSLDDGRRDDIRIQSQSRNAIRQSWREILGN